MKFYVSCIFKNLKDFFKNKSVARDYTLITNNFRISQYQLQ